MPVDPIITYIAQWAVLGAIVMVVLPKFEWKRQLSRRLYIFAAGPFVWIVWGFALGMKKMGVPTEYWR